MSPIIYKINNPTFREKMVAFDYDWTLVNPKNGKTFPSDIDDWQWMYPTIQDQIKKYYDDNYMIVIFTNQSKFWKCAQIQLVANSLNIPIFVVITMDKKEYKPNPIMFNIFTEEFTEKINKDLSFFVGYALGRKYDFADTDKLFAENIGIKCFSPENIFYKNTEIKNFSSENIIILTSEKPEIIIMMGYPASGKSSLALAISQQNTNYIIIEGDIYKTSSKMIKKSLSNIQEKKSIIFDATNSSIKKRKEYILLAQKYNYNIKCIHLTTSLDASIKRNINREENKQVPRIAFSVYSKYYEEPNVNEGFSLINV